MTLRDEFTSLLPSAEAENLASRAVLLGEFLASHAGKLPLQPLLATAHVHGHCHAKSFGAFLPGLANPSEGDVPDFAREVPQVRSGEPILRFNGKDLSGFYTHTRGHGYEDPLKVFTVQDGMIRPRNPDTKGPL